MAIWWLSKVIACGTTIVSATLFSYIVILHNRKKKEESKADGDIVFEIKITNTSLSNIHKGKQVLAKDSINPNNILLISKVGHVVSHLPKQTMSSAPVKLSCNKKLMQSKVGKNCNSINLNSGRSFAHDDSSVTIILNNSVSICESEFGSVQDNMNCSLVIHINNLTDLIKNTIELKSLNKSIKLSMIDMKTFNACANHSNNNRSANLLMINQKDVTQGMNIIISVVKNQQHK